MVIIAEFHKAPKISAKLSGGADYLSWAQEAKPVWWQMVSGNTLMSQMFASGPPLTWQSWGDWKTKNKVLLPLYPPDWMTSPTSHERILISSLKHGDKSGSTLSTQDPVSYQPNEESPCNPLQSPQSTLTRPIIDLKPYNGPQCLVWGMIKEDDWKTMVFINAH